MFENAIENVEKLRLKRTYKLDEVYDFLRCWTKLSDNYFCPKTR